MTPITLIAAMVGIWEILVILVVLGVLGLGAALIVFLIVTVSQKSSRSAPPPPSTPPQDVEQQLRTLAKLKEDGVITEEEFNAKKKALLGI